MGETHFTMSPQYNVDAMLLAGTLAFGLLMLAHPRPILASVVGVMAGLLVGWLQRQSLRLSPAEFAGARTALEVRRAFMSNRPGRLSIISWILAFLAASTMSSR